MDSLVITSNRKYTQQYGVIDLLQEVYQTNKVLMDLIQFKDIDVVHNVIEVDILTIQILT